MQSFHLFYAFLQGKLRDSALFFRLISQKPLLTFGHFAENSFRDHFIYIVCRILALPGDPPWGCFRKSGEK